MKHNHEHECKCFMIPPHIVEHIKKNHEALRILLETNRLKTIEPDIEYTQKVIKMSKQTGDFQNLSKPDISSISLCLQLGGSLITDDFAVSNVSKNLGIKVNPVMTSGIKKVGKWKYFCKACKKEFSNLSECPVCASTLTKKLFVKKSVPDKVN